MTRTQLLRGRVNSEHTGLLRDESSGSSTHERRLKVFRPFDIRSEQFGRRHLTFARSVDRSKNVMRYSWFKSADLLGGKPCQLQPQLLLLGQALLLTCCLFFCGGDAQGARCPQLEVNASLLQHFLVEGWEHG